MASTKEPALGNDEENGHNEDANALTTSKSVLQYFWDLPSYDKDTRVTAARGLVADLMADQAKHAVTLGKDSEAAPEDGAPKQKQLEYHLRRCSPTMTYTLRRLSRGLGSSNAAARQGFATALAGLLGVSAVEGGAAAGGAFISAAGAGVLLEACLDGPVRGGDAKDTLLGRVFGFGAILRSGLPLEQSQLAALLVGLLEAGAKKSFLREAAGAVALEAIGRMDAACVAGLTAPGNPLAALLATPPAEATPEVLLLALVLWPRLPAAALSTCKLLPAGVPPPPPELYAPSGAPVDAAAVAATAAGFFSKQHLTAILPPLLATSSSLPRLHTLWRYVLPLLLPGFTPHVSRRPAGQDGESAPEAPEASAPASGGKKAAKAAAKAAKAAASAAKAAEGKGSVSGTLLAAFWEVVVEGGLMASSHVRKVLGFELFSRCLPHLRPEHVGTVFSPNLTRTLANSLQRPDSYLHASSKKLMNGIMAFLERSGGEGADPAVKLAVAGALQRLGGLAPRQLAAGKLTARLVAGLEGDGARRYVEALTAAFAAGRRPLSPGSVAGGAGEEAEEKEAEEEGRSAEELASERRAACLEQLLAALKFPGANPEDVTAGLRFLALHAFAQLTPAKAAKSKIPEVAAAAAALASAPPLAPATRSHCAARLVTLLHHLAAAAGTRIRAAQQQLRRHQQAEKAQQTPATAGGDAAAAGQPAPKKRKTAGGAAAAAADAAPAAEQPAGIDVAAATAAANANPQQHLHDTLAFVRQVLAAPGVTPASPLGDAGEASLGLLTAIETAALAALPAAESATGAGAAARKDAPAAAAAGKKQKGKKGAKQQEAQPEPEGEAEQEGGGGRDVSRLRALATLAAQLQLVLLADPEGFESDLPISLRRVAAEGLGLRGLPEVEEAEEEEGGEKEGGASPSGPAPWGDVLVDMLLALLAQPSGQSAPGSGSRGASLPTAPVREAAEALWRGCCEGLGAAGLDDLIRVVAAGGKGAGQDAAGLFESDDEEEEEEEEESEEEGSEEEEEEESEEEEEEEEDGGKKAGAKKRKQEAAADSDEEEEEEEEGGKAAKDADASGSDDDEGMDDEAMFRMDDKLAAYFRSLAAGRAGGGGAAERAAALVNFRLRALALIEVFAKKAPRSPVLLGALVPLVRALATASRPGGQPQVADRLRAVLNGKLCRASVKLDSAALASLGGAEGYAASLKRLLYEASRNRERAVAGVALQAYMALLRAGAGAEEPAAAEAARASFRAALKDFLASRKTQLPADAMGAAFRTTPAVCLPALDLLLGAVADGRNGTVRAAAATLAVAVLKSAPEGLAAALRGGPGSGGMGGALGAAMAAAVAGVGLKTELHARTANAAVSMAESLKRVLPDKRAPEVLGPDKVNAIAKAVATVRSLEPVHKVATHLKRLEAVMALTPLLAKTQPDPALAARITKARPVVPAPAAPAAKADGKEQGGKAEGKGKKGEEAKGKKGGKEDKAAAAAAGKDKERKQKQEQAAAKKRKAKEEEEEEEEEEAEEEEEGSGSDSEMEAGVSGSEDEEEGPSSSGREDSEEEEEEDAGRKRGGKGKGKGKGGAPGGGAKGQGGKGGAAQAKKQQRKGGPGGGGGKGPGKQQRQKGKQGGGSPAKKARR